MNIRTMIMDRTTMIREDARTYLYAFERKWLTTEVQIPRLFTKRLLKNIRLMRILHIIPELYPTVRKRYNSYNIHR